MKVWSGSAWAEKPTKVWSGSAWVAKPVKVWSGSAWVTKPPAGGAIVAPVFRSVANTTYASRSGSTVVNAPAGVANNDIMILAAVLARADAAGIVYTPPAGWTELTTVATVGAGGFFAKFSIYWKRAASEGASYTITHANTLSTQAAVAAWSGCPTASSPVDAFSQNSASTGSTATANGVTTTQANDKLLYVGHNWDGTGTLTPPSGMTERFDILVYIADETIAAASATGNRTQTLASSNPWQAALVALKGI